MGPLERGSCCTEALTFSLRQSGVRPVGVHTEKLRRDEGIEHLLAGCGLDAAQSLHLRSGQAHSRHFTILGAKTVQQNLRRRGHIDLPFNHTHHVATGVSSRD